MNAADSSSGRRHILARPGRLQLVTNLPLRAGAEQLQIPFTDLFGRRESRFASPAGARCIPQNRHPLRS